MAYASKSDQRAQLSKSYSGGEATLNSKGVTMPKSRSDNGPSRLIGSAFTKGNSMSLYGQTVKRSMTSGVTGQMKGDGYPNGPKQARVSDDSTRTRSNTTVIKPQGENRESFPMKNTGTMPKALRGGR